MMFALSSELSSIDDNDGCSQGLRPNSVTGSLAPSLNPTSVPTAPQLILFHRSGCAAANGNSVRLAGCWRN